MVKFILMLFFRRGGNSWINPYTTTFFKLTWRSRASECRFCETVPRPARWYPLSFPWQHVVEAQTRADVPATNTKAEISIYEMEGATPEFAHTRRKAAHFNAKARLVTQFAEAAKVSERLLMVAAHALGNISPTSPWVEKAAHAKY